MKQIFQISDISVSKISFKVSQIQKLSFADVLWIGVLKNFVNFTGMRLIWSLFLIKLQAEGLQPY